MSTPPSHLQPGCSRRSRTPQGAANRRDGSEEPRVGTGRLAALPEVDVDDLGDPTWPGRHDDDAVRQEHRLGDRVGDEDDRRAGLGLDADQLRLHVLARHLVQGAERLVHQQDPWSHGQRPGDGDPLLHPAGQLPRTVPREVVQVHELEQLARPLAAATRAPAEQLERQLDIGRDGAPVEEPGLLERHPVVVVEPGLTRRLAVDLD